MKRTTWRVCALVAGLIASAPAAAGGSKQDIGLQDVGDGVAIALPLVAGGISLYKDDWNGAGQLVLATAATVGTSYGLQHVVREERPYCRHQPGCPDDSFPSNTSALAFAPAQYLWNRYGWEYGAPAYVAAGFAGATRIISNSHNWWDVATSGAISWTYNWIITSRYHPPENLQSGVIATPHGAMVAVNYRW